MGRVLPLSRCPLYPYWPGLLLIAAMWASFAVWISWDRSVELRDATQTSATLVESLTAHTAQVVGEADRATNYVARIALAQGLDLDLQEWRRNGLLDDPAFVQVAIVDAHGILRASTVDGFRPIDVSDRDHIRVHLVPGGSASGDLYIGKPVVGRTSGKPSIQVSRAIRWRDGTLLGVAVVSMDPTYFTGLYKLLRIGRQGLVTVVGTRDFVIRARRTQAEESLGETLPPDSPLRAAIANAPRGTFRAVSRLDHIERIYSYQRIERFPLAVAVGFSTDEYLQAFRHRRNLLLVSGAFLTLLIAFAEVRRVSLWHKLVASATRERKAMEQEAENAAHLKALFRAIPDAAIAFSDGTVQDVNPRLAPLLDVENQSLSGQPPRALATALFARDMSEDQEEKIDTLVQALEPQAPQDSRRLVFTLKTPRVLVLEVRIEPLPSPYHGVVALIRDITAQTQVDRMKSEFVATAAHELRTPTAGILGLSELLAADRVPAPRKQSIYEMIRDQAKALSALVSDLLDLARIEARADKDFNMEEFDFQDVIDSAIGKLPGVRERVERDSGDESVRVRGDYSQLETVVRNLLENCMKYSAPDTPIRIRAKKAGPALRVTVEDEGIGIAQNEQDKVFDRFYRVDKHAAVAGTGLGLALVREIVQLHGGRVWLESTPGVGTRVSFSIPTQA